MRYNLSMRKSWRSWLRQDFQKWFYKTFYGFKMGGVHSGTILPQTGKGKYVSVYQKGKIIQIIDHEKEYEYDEIRIIPYQPNHGIMVERWKEGKMCGRDHLGIEQFNKSIIFASNVEQLTGRPKTNKNK